MIRLERHEKPNWIEPRRSKMIESGDSGILKKKSRTTTAVSVEGGSIIVRTMDRGSSGLAGIYSVDNRLGEDQLNSAEAQRAMKAPRSIADVIRGRRVWFTAEVRPEPNIGGKK